MSTAVTHDMTDVNERYDKLSFSLKVEGFSYMVSAASIVQWRGI